MPLQDDASLAGWDQAVENSLIFSNPFADTSEIAPTPHTYFKAAISPDVNPPVNGSRWAPGQDYHDKGTLGVAETGFGHTGGRQQFGFGSWQYQAYPDALTPPDQKPSTGVYVTAQRTFYNTDNKTIVGFATAGNAPGDITDMRNGWGAGFVMKGFMQDRPDGQFRFAMTGGTHTAIAEPNGAHPLETHFELTYSDKLSDNVSIQPGLNYTVNPRNDPAAPGGLVAGLRLHVSFK